MGIFQRQLFVAAGGAGGKALQEPINIFIFGSARTMASSQRGADVLYQLPVGGAAAERAE